MSQKNVMNKTFPFLKKYLMIKISGLGLKLVTSFENKSKTKLS